MVIRWKSRWDFIVVKLMKLTKAAAASLKEKSDFIIINSLRDFKRLSHDSFQGTPTTAKGTLTITRMVGVIGAETIADILSVFY